SAWRYEGDEVRYEFTVPAGLTAEVSLPDGRKYDVRVDAFNDTGITKGTTVRLS
ncbi:MAG: hypothetical protein IKY02_06390, partial [Lachnospiraceae bacterium]|nr:hypothetical protein [Lachnospiraceae bacterium]